MKDEKKSQAIQKRKFSFTVGITYLIIQLIGSTENMFTYIVQTLENGMVAKPFFPYHGDTSQYCGAADKVSNITS